MQVDESRAVIEPRRGRHEETLPSSAIFVFTPGDVEIYLNLFPERPHLSHKIFLSNVYVGTYQGTRIAMAGPMLGAPQSVMVLEKLIALGVHSVLAVGWCGSLQSHVAIGDIVLPAGAISEEGTSRHYPTPGRLPGPSQEMLDPLRRRLLEGGLRVHEGLVWSTDAPFRETAGKILAYQRQGVLAVEMEASALFAVSCFRSVRTALAMVVSDDLSSLEWVHGFRKADFLLSREKVAAGVLDAVSAAGGGGQGRS